MSARTAAVVACLALLPALVFAQGAKRNPSEDFVAAGPVVALPVPIAAAVDTVRAEKLAAHIEFLAASSLEGRGLGRQGLEATADYVATTLSLAGIRPLGGTAKPGTTTRESYFQPVALREIANARGQLTVESAGANGSRSQTFLSGIDCVFPEIAPQTLSGGVVFAAYGLRELSLGRDDYRDLDVRDKVVVILAGLPGGAEWQKPELVARYGAERGQQRYTAKFDLAVSLGARAVLFLEPPEFAATLAARSSVPAPYFLNADELLPERPPLFVATSAVTAALFGATSAGAEGERPRALPGVTLTIRVVGDERAVLSRNVIGVLPGTATAGENGGKAGASLAGEAVVLGAHMDHLGRSGDAIYRGADDNASGVAALLEIAKAFAGSPVKPRRTLVFAFWTGEEEGHLGSEYYVRHPRWPLDRTALYENLDMIGHPWLREEIAKLVTDSGLPAGSDFVARVNPANFIEPGVAESAPDLCRLLTQSARGLGLAVHFDRTDGKSGGSDYRAFARKGRPFIRFFGNYFPGYHEPTDTVEGVDVGQVQRIARLALATAWLAADR